MENKYVKNQRSAPSSGIADESLDEDVKTDIGWYPPVDSGIDPAELYPPALDNRHKSVEAERLLEEKDKKFRMIYENANDIIVWMDPSGIITNINRKVEEVFGYWPAEMIGKRFDELKMLSLEDLQERLTKLKAAIKGEIPFSRIGMKKREFKALHKNGKTIDIESNPKVIIENDKVTGIIIIIRDISEQKQAEREILAREQEFRNILENSYDLVYRVDLGKDTFDYVSPSSVKILGYTPQEMIKFGYRKMTSITHEDDFPRIKDYFDLRTVTRQEDTETMIEYRVKHKDLGYRWVCHTRMLIFDSDHKPIAFIGNTRDIHKRKQSEIALEELHQELQQKVRDRTANLADANTALKVLIKQMDKEKEELEDRILLNIKELITPALDRLKSTHLDDVQNHQLDVIEANLMDITSPFSKKLTSKFFNFTHGEIQVANLIMEGKTTKEIADIVNLSNRTIDFHRAQIRKKVDIANKKENLRSYLLSLK